MEEFYMDKNRRTYPRSAETINQRVRQIELGNDVHSPLIDQGPPVNSDSVGSDSGAVSFVDVIIGAIIGAIKGGIIGGVGGAFAGAIIGAFLGANYGAVYGGLIGGDMGGDIGGDGGE